MFVGRPLTAKWPWLTSCREAAREVARILGTKHHEVLIESGPFVMGTSDDTWALDNERPAHRVDVPAYWIDASPVTAAAYLSFVEAGGYDDERWWDPRGWDWRCRSGKRSPAFWFRARRKPP